MTYKQLQEQRFAVVKDIEALKTKVSASIDDESVDIGALQAEFEKTQSKLNAIDAKLRLIKETEELAKQESPSAQASSDKPFATPRRGFANLGEQLGAICHASAKGAIPDERLLGLQATAGQSTTTGAEGGFLLEPQFAAAIYEKVFEQAVFSSRCTPQPIGEGRGSFVANYRVEAARTDGQRFGGVLAYREKERGALTKTKTTFNQIELKPEKLSVYIEVSNEMLEDSTAMAAYIPPLAGQALSFRIDREIFAGNGAGEALGIMNSPALVTVAKDSGQAAATLSVKNITNMYSRIMPDSKSRGAWFVNSSIAPELYSLTIGNLPAYMPPNGLSGAPYGTLFGRPVIETEHNEVLGTVGDIVFADLNEYLMVTKGNLRADSSMHVAFDYDVMAYRFITRINGQPWWESALTPNKGGASNTLSPFVALATRA